MTHLINVSSCVVSLCVIIFIFLFCLVAGILPLCLAIKIKMTLTVFAGQVETY